MDCCKKRLEDNLFLEPEEKTPHLLRTIRVTKNISCLTDMMPKPNYSPLKYKESPKKYTYSRERLKSLGTIN
jgi:NIMA (never in mitosis gene a)-related kinase